MKLWGGAFYAKNRKLAEEFNSSLDFESRLYKQDILGSIAHCKMLGPKNHIGGRVQDNNRRVRRDFG